jgi:hypothetical protein
MRRTLLTRSFVASLFLVLMAQMTKSSAPDTDIRKKRTAGE